jgi:HK97 family phage major capsid protein
MQRITVRSTLAALGAVAAVALAFLAFKAIEPMATPVFLLGSKTTLWSLAPLGAMMGRTQATDAPTGTVTLSSKNRAAQELRSKAQALRDEILDTSKSMTVDELKQKQDAINGYEQRANAIAEFTADDEVRRQGGTGGLERIDVDAPDGTINGKGKRALKRGTMASKIEDFAVRAIDAFGDVRKFMRIAVAGQEQLIENDEQRKLIQEAKTLTRAIIGTTGDTSGGEYLLPLTQVASIFSLSNVQQGVLQRARTYNVPGRTLRIPYLIQDAAGSTTLDRPAAGMIANVSIVGEGSTKPVREPQFGQRLLTVYKYAAITQASDEILGDDFTGELPQEFVNAVGQQALNKVNEDVTIDGTGSSQPLGALYTSGAHLIKQSRAGSNAIAPADLFGMYSKHTHGPGSVWFASRRTVQQLFAMSLTSASLVTFLRDLNSAPQMQILGYPVILTDILPTLGSEGDIALVNPDFYALALRQALTVESSRDFAFTQDLTTYRFIVRAGGIPMNTGTYAYKYSGTTSAKVDEHSPFVVLDN